jgi:hypothetical protein
VCDDAAEAILVLKRRAERLVDLGTTWYELRASILLQCNRLYTYYTHHSLHARRNILLFRILVIYITLTDHIHSDTMTL